MSDKLRLPPPMEGEITGFGFTNLLLKTIGVDVRLETVDADATDTEEDTEEDTESD